MSWEQLKNILDENRITEEEETTSCPQCAYVPLKENERGEKCCPICGWRGR